MKNSSLLFLTLLTFSSLNAAAQQTKNPIRKTSAESRQNLFNVSDFNNYIIVERYQDDKSAAENYTLKRTLDYSKYIVFDIKTGKEVAWWPLVNGTYHSKVNKMIYSTDNQTLYGFSEVGKPIFKKELRMPATGPFQGAWISLSHDWTQSAFTYNNDLWISKFDATTGSIGQPKQVTANGVMFGDRTYLKDSIALTTSDAGRVSGKLINLNTGRFIEFFGPWENTNRFITNYFYVQDRDTGLGVFNRLGFIKLPNSRFVCWIDPEQTSYIVQSNSTNKYTIVKILPGDGRVEKIEQLRFKSPILDEKKFPISVGAGQTHNVSPKFDKIFERSGNEDKDGLVIYDLKNGAVSFHSIVTQEDLAYNWNDRVSWTDENHLIILLRPNDILNEEKITTSTQGTYIYDINTKKGKLLTAYYIDTERRDGPIFQITTNDGNFTIFSANNFLFRCKPDGADLEQVTKIPNLYGIRSKFMGYHPWLK